MLYAGQLVEHAPTGAIYRSPRHPYTRALLDAIPRLEDPAHEPLRTIGGGPPDLRRPPTGCRFADRCLLLFGDGRWELGPVGEILDEKRLEEAYNVSMDAIEWRGKRYFIAGDRTG